MLDDRALEGERRQSPASRSLDLLFLSKWQIASKPWRQTKFVTYIEDCMPLYQVPGKEAYNPRRLSVLNVFK